ncbi:putative FMN-linked oxidoreductase [Rosellinia necatrix]|uniref:Putative FMN-linked oxidoreductase n=1 Tax=Rosellinia necatrix TaxID=77044 RepID=A0A1S7ULC8_ROSNE|nr:putative FMN-linked oxidoreductase [Rosellinia necatrix]
MSQREVPRWPSTATDVRPLAEPLTFPFSGRTAPNRLLKAATSERLSSYDEADVEGRGIPSQQLIDFYARYARGGWGQILTGNVQISYTDLEAAGNAIVPPGAPFSGPRFDAFAALAAGAKAGGGGGLIVAQVSHPGRQVPAALQPHPISASAVPLVAGAMGPFGVPREATREDIAGVVEGFAHAAAYLERAGFDGVELHGAHGYLLAQFLSPTTNRRTDGYGGSLENRARLVLEVAAAIKARVGPAFVLGIKINSVEFQDKGFTPEEAVALCRALERAGFDYVETSGGTYEEVGFRHKKESTIKRENYFVEFAERIAQAVDKMKVYTTGGLKTVDGMLSTIEGIDGLGFGRAAIQEPSFAADILSGKITGAMKSAVPDSNFFGQLTTTSYVLRQVARGEEPADLTDPKVVDEILASAGKPI